MNSVSTLPPLVTRDLRIASHLKALGHEPRPVVVDSRTVAFEFTSTPAILTEVNNFSLGRARVDPLRFDQARAELRRQVDELLVLAKRGGGVR